ncbi:MAG: GAF domain-containing protein [Bacteroidales bacterium]|nr:GAF domain-containing protein [Bacteroidales bacterium]
MIENIKITATTKKEKYELLLQQIKSLVEGENDLIANLSNIASALKFGMNFFWIGFYFVKENELVLGPFQGTIACTRIKKGKGVCGTCWEQKKTMIVEDVEKFPGHIACSSLSRSEIVVPVFDKNNNVAMVLDVDSTKLSDFDETDKSFLEKIAEIIKNII